MSFLVMENVRRKMSQGWFLLVGKCQTVTKVLGFMTLIVGAFSLNGRNSSWFAVSLSLLATSVFCVVGIVVVIFHKEDQ